eukprot:CAMPEP_0198422116 /NCGR_PEP_ID=MMETSP1452-20131203/2147_1 /TAXON_ID=1181717 /ORGANISM="Synchroma pusillum, Strain CCMP3072" /LENGTH=199 /DNA_ID=CAMNT_0044142369 /DNA_START=15 /DNA_END=611 /DNA_ORIENTATION=-
MNIEKVQVGSQRFMLLDYGGRDGMRAAWLSTVHRSPPDAIVYVVEHTGMESGRAEENAELIQSLLISCPNSHEIPFMILANKQDVCPLPAQEVKDRLRLSEIMGERTAPYEVFPTVATTGEGVEKAFKWLLAAMAQQKSMFLDSGGVCRGLFSIPAAAPSESAAPGAKAADVVAEPMVRDATGGGPEEATRGERGAPEQ